MKKSTAEHLFLLYSLWHTCSKLNVPDDFDDLRDQFINHCCEGNYEDALEVFDPEQTLGAPFMLNEFYQRKTLPPDVFGRCLRSLHIYSPLARDLTQIVSNAKLLNFFAYASPYTLMREEEWESIKYLPDELTIYRGGFAVSKDLKHLKTGLSWTLDLETAQYFSYLYAQTAHNAKADGVKVVAKATISRKNVIAFFVANGEEEIVTNPKYIRDFEILYYDYVPQPVNYNKYILLKEDWPSSPVFTQEPQPNSRVAQIDA